MRKALQGALITFASVTACSALLPNSVFAAAKSEISAKVGKPLQEAKDLIAAKKFKEAIGKVKEEAMPDKKPAEDALINEMLSYLYLQTKDYNSALNVYESMLAKANLRRAMSISVY